MIEGTVEQLSPTGVFTGWLRDTEDPGPAAIELRQDGVTLATAAACDFRPDLLAGGHGHGHYGFNAVLRFPLPPGSALLDLFLPRHNQGIRVRLNVPELTLPPPVTVETLLRRPGVWTVPQALPHLACLNLETCRAAMGSARFVDVSGRFALRRWPTEAEAAVYIRALQRGELTAEGLLREMLSSRERMDLGPELASPWDPEFPYTGALCKKAAA